MNCYTQKQTALLRQVQNAPTCQVCRTWHQAASEMRFVPVVASL